MNAVILALGLGPLAAPGSAGGVGVGHLQISLGRVSLAAGLREGVATGELREMGNIFLGATLPLGPVHLRGGFTHTHEVPWADFRERPITSLIGSDEGIGHRSGLELALGSRRDLQPVSAGATLGAWVETSVQVFPDDVGPHVYGLVEVGLDLRVVGNQ